MINARVTRRFWRVAVDPLHENKNGLGTPEEWLRRAKSNLAIARQPKTDDILKIAIPIL